MFLISGTKSWKPEEKNLVRRTEIMKRFLVLGQGLSMYEITAPSMEEAIKELQKNKFDRFNIVELM